MKWENEMVWLVNVCKGRNEVKVWKGMFALKGVQLGMMCEHKMVCLNYKECKGRNEVKVWYGMFGLKGAQLGMKCEYEMVCLV